MVGVTGGLAQPSPVTSISELLADPGVPRSTWSISDILAIELAAYLDRVRPKRILEVGSGLSTAVLAAYAVTHGAKVISLEHACKYYVRTARGLAKLRLSGSVDLRLASLRRQQFGRCGSYRWYDVPLEDSFDFVFVDGPPRVMGRWGVFFAVKDHLQPGWRMWMDDGLRNHEQACIRLWERHVPGCFFHEHLNIDGKGVFILRDAGDEQSRGAERKIPGRLGIGVLGNGDSGWWRRAKRNVGDQLLDSSYVVVTARDQMPAPRAPRLPKLVDKHLPADGRSPQQGIWRMFEELSRQPDVDYVLYLDDRWFPATLDERWLARALDILQTRPDVEQVSLQHQIDVTAGANGQGFLKPFTGAPSLLRADRLGTPRPLRTVHPPHTEEPPLHTVQLLPGVFRHTNGHGRPVGPT